MLNEFEQIEGDWVLSDLKTDRKYRGIPHAYADFGKAEFEGCPFKKQLLHSKAPVMVLLCGSRAVGEQDEDSDVDLLALCKNSDYMAKRGMVRYKGTPVHTYIADLYTHIENDSLLWAIGMFKFYYIGESHVLMNTDATFAEEFFKHKSALWKIGVHRLDERLRGEIQEAVSKGISGELPEGSKWMCQFCEIAYAISGVDYTGKLDFLKRVRRAAKNPLSPEDKLELLHTLEDYLAFIDRFKQDNPYQSLLDEWDAFIQDMESYWSEQ